MANLYTALLCLIFTSTSDILWVIHRLCISNPDWGCAMVG